jgi:hypothetical protein
MSAGEKLALSFFLFLLRSRVKIIAFTMKAGNVIETDEHAGEFKAP